MDEKKESNVLNIIAIILTLILTIGGVIFYVGSGAGTPKSKTHSTIDSNAWKSNDNSSMALVMMQKYVKRQLKTPSTAKWPLGTLDHAASIGNQKYEIKSYVDSQNGFGAMIRTNYTGVIEQVSNRDWKLITLKTD